MPPGSGRSGAAGKTDFVRPPVVVLLLFARPTERLAQRTRQCLLPPSIAIGLRHLHLYHLGLVGPARLPFLRAAASAASRPGAEGRGDHGAVP